MGVSRNYPCEHCVHEEKDLHSLQCRTCVNDDKRPNYKTGNVRTFLIKRVDVSWLTVEATSKKEALEYADNSDRWQCDIGKEIVSVVKRS